MQTSGTDVRRPSENGRRSDDLQHPRCVVCPRSHRVPSVPDTGTRKPKPKTNGITNRCRNFDSRSQWLSPSSALAGSASAQIIVQAANVTVDTTWGDNETEVVLQQPIFVNNGATLTILQGTIIRGQPRSAAVVPGSTVGQPGRARRHAEGQDPGHRRRERPDHHDDRRGRQRQQRRRRRRGRLRSASKTSGSPATSSSTTLRRGARSHRSTSRGWQCQRRALGRPRPAGSGADQPRQLCGLG